MTHDLFPAPSKETSQRRRQLAEIQEKAFKQFSRAVFIDGVLSARTKHVIAVAVAHVTQCPYCIQGHTKAAINEGALPEEIMEAIWVAAEMRAGAAFAHSLIAIEALDGTQSGKG